MPYDVEYKLYSNLEEWRLWIPQPRTPDELGRAVAEIAASTLDWSRIAVTHARKAKPKPAEKPHHD